MIRYLLKSEFRVSVVNADDAIGRFRGIAKADAMLIRAYLVFLNLGAGFEVREGDPVFSVRTRIGFMTQSIGRDICHNRSGGNGGTAGQCNE